jgi:uncharacterized protein YeaO (DUF488 family)
MAGPARVRLRRVYDQPEPADGRRVLVDRLWPRGLSKERAALDDWLREVAPSNELRRWYGHQPGRFSDFRQRYQRELCEPEGSAAFGRLRDLAGSGPVTLLTATRDLEHSQAAVLAGLLRSGMTPQDEEDLSADPACWLRRVCPACGNVAPTDPPVTCPNCHTEITGE